MHVMIQKASIYFCEGFLNLSPKVVLFDKYSDPVNTF